MDFHFWTSISFFVVLAACGVATAQDKAETAKAVVPKFYCYQT